MGKSGLAVEVSAAGIYCRFKITSTCGEDDVEAISFEWLGPNRIFGDLCPKNKCAIIEQYVCEQGFYKARVDSVVRVKRPAESDPRLRGSGPMSDGPG